MTDASKQLNQEIAFYVGIDWADQKHDCYIIDRDGNARHLELVHSPDAINQWLADMTARADGGKIAIILEQSRGPLIHALMNRDNVVLFPINPKQLARYRESYPGGDNKNDPSDARYLARMLCERFAILRPWLPDDEETRLLNGLCEQRRRLVETQTGLRQQLISVLKQYFPLALDLFGCQHQVGLLVDMVKSWSDPRQLKRADRRSIFRVLKEHGIRSQEKQLRISDAIRSATLLTDDRATIVPLAMTAKLLAEQIRQLRKSIQSFDDEIAKVFHKHPDSHLFSSLRGAGPALAPRLLCAFGSQPDRWSNADQLASFSGIAPITKQSGKQRTVQRRHACPKYLRQTFHEFADAASKWCPWTRARYKMLKDSGMKHHAILRKLARSWIRILFRIWKTKEPFDAKKYIDNLRHRLPGIIPYLDSQ